MKLRCTPLLSSVRAAAMALSLVACGGTDTDELDEVSLELATHVAALEANEDGSDVNALDATEEEPFVVRTCGIAGIRQQLIERFDQNADGELDATEREALSDEYGGRVPVRRGFRRVARLRRLLLLREVYDADGSGSLDATERASLEADLEARCMARQTALLERFDADGDGELSDSEWQAVVQDIRERFRERRAELLARYDEDDDGRLGPRERYLAREDLRDSIQQHRDDLVEEFDADGNGQLGDEEREQLRSHLRERVRTPRFMRLGSE